MHSPESSPPAGKSTYVNALFSAIVRRYDLMNRLMTVGRDQAWRRRAADFAEVPPGGKALDVAAGTADLSIALAQRFPSGQVVALDFNLPMLHRGRDKAAPHSCANRIAFLAGDALRLPFADGEFDAVTSAFLMRNVTSVPETFSEMRRVVRPAGKVICLELTQPATPIFRQLFWFYFTRVVPRLGQIISGQREAYTYLPRSLSGFFTVSQMQEMMEAAGLEEVTFITMMAGTVAIHVGQRPLSTER